MPEQANQPLPEGFQLLEYRILRVLASGGFSFVYLAHDENDAPVAIKEYLPAALALRVNSSPVPAVHEDNRGAFRHGLKSFFEEGKALAGLAHPNVVRVLNFFRANETVYMVMRYERGRTLHEHIQRREGALDEAWLRGTFAALLNGLREVHAAKLLHLDIKPANIYLRNDGTPLLLDFGAARQTVADGGASLPPMYTPGFASPEHHGAREQLGPWSDLYSIGATVYACLQGATPLAASARLGGDRLAPARKAWAGKYSGELLDTVDWCLRLEPAERPQSARELQLALLGEQAPRRRRRAQVLERLEAAYRKFSGR